MTIRRSLVPWTGVLLFAMATTELMAQSGRGAARQNELPSGKPFQQIQTELDAVNQRIQALQLYVNGVETSLKTQIAGINASYDALHTWIDSVDRALTSLDARVDANQALIAAHQSVIGSLEASLVGIQTDLTALQNQLVAGSTDPDANTAAILALQEQAAGLQKLIDEHSGQIAILQGQIASVSQFLTAMATATCGVGEAISDIGAGGLITCTTTAGLDVRVTQMAWNFGPNVLKTFEVPCPAGYKAVSGGYDGAYGIAVVSAFPNPTSYLIRVQSPFVNSSIQVFATCAR
jgi:septal ring factor EnvC (AmiA/AmiB activator)